MEEAKLTNVLLMQFEEISGKSRKIRKLKLPNPRKDLKADEIKSVMDKIAEKNLYWFDVKPYGAKIVKTEISDMGIKVD